MSGAKALRCLSDSDVDDAAGGGILVRPLGERSFYAHHGEIHCVSSKRIEEGTVYTGGNRALYTVKPVERRFVAGSRVKEKRKLIVANSPLFLPQSNLRVNLRGSAPRQKAEHKRQGGK
jgi:hypothetical protein